MLTLKDFPLLESVSPVCITEDKEKSSYELFHHHLVHNVHLLYKCDFTDP